MITFDFNDGNGPVPAHQHSNGGGWVADTATVKDTAYVGLNARVYGNAQVCGNALVFDNACVSGTSRVYGDARVSQEDMFIEMNGKRYKLVEIV